MPTTTESEEVDATRSTHPGHRRRRFGDPVPPASKRTCARGAQAWHRRGSTTTATTRGSPTALMRCETPDRSPTISVPSAESPGADDRARRGRAGTDKVPLVVHLPGFTEETVRQTPIFESTPPASGTSRAWHPRHLGRRAGSAPIRWPRSRRSPNDPRGGRRLARGAPGSRRRRLAAQLRAEAAAVFDDLSPGDSSRVNRHRPYQDALWEPSHCLDRVPLLWRDTMLPARDHAPRTSRSPPRAGRSAWSTSTISSARLSAHIWPTPRTAAPGRRDLPGLAATSRSATRPSTTAWRMRPRPCCRRGRNRPARGPRQDLHVPVRGGPRPHGGDGLTGTVRTTSTPP